MTPAQDLKKNQLLKTTKTLETKMDSKEAFEKVKKIIAEQLGVDESEIKDESHFIDDLGADSLDTVELVMALEEEFGIEIPDESAEKIQTVGDVRKFIEEHS